MTEPTTERLLTGSDGGRRRLWMYVLPGLTNEIFIKAAFDTGIAKRVTVGDQEIELWPKIGEMTGEGWTAIRDECARVLGLPRDWERVQGKRKGKAA